ncbi:MAG TPA: hypothetical protein VJP77_00180, partial [Planctomycetota bacterium]|nr:hypothetical protein [Planctomycetota bacterium]
MSESSASPVDPLNPPTGADARGPTRVLSEAAYREWVHEQVAASLLRRLLKLTGAGLVALVVVSIGYVELLLKGRILDEVDQSVAAAEARLVVEGQRAAVLAVAQDSELVPDLIKELVERDPGEAGPSLVGALVAKQEFVAGLTSAVVRDQQLRTSVQSNVREAMVNEEAKAWIVEGVQKTIEGSPSVLVDALVGNEQRTGLLAEALGEVLEYSLIAERCYRILDDESRPPSVRQRAIDMLVLFEEDREKLEVALMRWVRAGGADAEFLARCLEGAVASLVAPGAGGDGLCTDGVLAGLRAFSGPNELAQPL